MAKRGDGDIADERTDDGENAAQNIWRGDRRIHCRVENAGDETDDGGL